QRKANVAHSPGLAPGILKPYILEHEPLSYWPRHFKRAGRRRYRRFHLKKVEHVFEKKTLLINPTRAHQQHFDQLLASRERSREKSQRPDGELSAHCPNQYDCVSGVITQRSYQRQCSADIRFANRKPLVLLVELPREFAEPLYQPRRQSEQLHFLCCSIAGGDVA